MRFDSCPDKMWIVVMAKNAGRAVSLVAPLLALCTSIEPQSLREASIGLGASKFQTLVRVVLPAAGSLIVYDVSPDGRLLVAREDTAQAVVAKDPKTGAYLLRADLAPYIANLPAAIQLGKAFGAKVVVTDSPAERVAQCKALGADRAIDYRNEDFVDIVRDELGGADVILDIVGGPYIARNVKAARPDARIVQLAFAMGSKVEFDFMPIMLKRLHYTGSTLRSRNISLK